jgi:hypothetical protein
MKSTPNSVPYEHKDEDQFLINRDATQRNEIIIKLTIKMQSGQEEHKQQLLIVKNKQRKLN